MGGGGGRGEWRGGVWRERVEERARERASVHVCRRDRVYVGGEGVCVCESAWSPTQ